VAVDKVVCVIAVRHSIVSAVRTVLVLVIVAAAIVAVGAVSRILRVHFQPMLVNVPFVHVVQVIDVIVMLNRGMSAVFAVFMWVVRVGDVVVCHWWISFRIGEVPWDVVDDRRVRLFRSVRHAIEHEVKHMLIGQKIDQMFALPAAAYDIVGTEHAKSLGYDSNGFTLKHGEFSDASRRL
jgi:hypothetical protein